MQNRPTFILPFGKPSSLLIFFAPFGPFASHTGTMSLSPYQQVPDLEGVQIPQLSLQLNGKLGHGTFGVVFSATNVAHNAPRAVKVLR